MVNKNRPLFYKTDLDENNRWVRIGQCIPWDELAEFYYQGLSDEAGRLAKDIRMVIGATIIKHKLCLTDVETVFSDSWQSVYAMLCTPSRLSNGSILCLIFCYSKSSIVSIKIFETKWSFGGLLISIIDAEFNEAAVQFRWKNLTWNSLNLLLS